MQPLRGRWTYNKLHITLFERLPFWDHVGATGNAQSCISHYFGGFRFGTAWGPIETHTAAYHTISEASVLGPLRGQWTRTQLHMHYFGGFRFGTLGGQLKRTPLHITLFRRLPFWDRLGANGHAHSCISHYLRSFRFGTASGPMNAHKTAYLKGFRFGTA